MSSRVAGINAAAKFAVTNAVEEINQQPDDRARPKNRIQVSIGRLSIRATHIRTPRIGNNGTNGTRNGRGRLGFFFAQHDHAEADENEGEERPDVRQVGQANRYRSASRRHRRQHRSRWWSCAACGNADECGRNIAAAIRPAPSP